jgi:hypothetical protein
LPAQEGPTRRRTDDIGNGNRLANGFGLKRPFNMA